MALSKKLMRGTSLLTAGEVLSKTLVFIRTVIVMRMLTTAEYGIAYTFVITVAFFKMASDMSTDRVVIQSPDGDNPDFQKTAQAMEFLRGLLMAVLLYALAGPIASYFDANEFLWAFQLLAIVPLLRSLVHLDIFVAQRRLHYKKAVLCETISQVIAAGLAYPICRWKPNPGAIIYLLICQMLVYVVISHLLAKQRYSWRMNKAHAKYILKFGLPLVLNGLLLYGISQGDRFIIAGFGYTKAELGIYSAAFSLPFMLTLLVSRVNSSIMLPTLSQSRDNPRAYLRRYRLGLIGIAGVAGTVAVVLIIAGGAIATFIYSEKYAAVGKVIGWLAAMQAIRIMRSTPSMAALAKGHTKVMPWTNIFRSLAFVAMLVVGYFHFDLVWISIAGFGGEVLALIVVTYLLKRYCQLPVWCTVQAILPPAVAALAGALLIRFGLISAPHFHPIEIGYALPFLLKVGAKLLASIYEICILLQWAAAIIAVMILSLYVIFRKIQKQDESTSQNNPTVSEATVEIMKTHLAEESHEEEL